MEHAHPQYEQTFARIATILDVLAGDQAKQDRAMTRVTDALALLAERSAESEKKLSILSERMASLSERMAILAERGAESEDKLNALIDLMDRHIREHKEDRQQ